MKSTREFLMTETKMILSNIVCIFPIHFHFLSSLVSNMKCVVEETLEIFLCGHSMKSVYIENCLICHNCYLHSLGMRFVLFGNP